MKKLSAFQLSCGYVQERKIGADKVELYREHMAYHVRRFSDSVCGRRIQEAWLVFETVAEARRAFNRQVEISKSINFQEKLK